MSNELLFFGGFLLFITLMLAIDLGLFSKSNSAVSFKQAAIMSAVWVAFALGFYVVLRIWGHELHNLEDFARLAAVTVKHLHHIRLIPDDFITSLDMYRRQLAPESIPGYVFHYAPSLDQTIFRVLV